MLVFGNIYSGHGARDVKRRGRNSEKCGSKKSKVTVNKMPQDFPFNLPKHHERGMFNISVTRVFLSSRNPRKHENLRYSDDAFVSSGLSALRERTEVNKRRSDDAAFPRKPSSSDAARRETYMAILARHPCVPVPQRACRVKIRAEKQDSHKADRRFASE